MATEPSSARYTTGPRRIRENGDGSYNGETKTEGGNTYYWDEDAEEWINNTPIGTTKTENGQTLEWNGSKWVVVKGTDPYVPVGPMPWLFMAVLSAAYVVVKSGKLKVKSGKLTTKN